MQRSSTPDTSDAPTGLKPTPRLTREGFELVLQIKCLPPQGGQIHTQSRADGKLFNTPADLKDLVCDGLLGRTCVRQRLIRMQKSWKNDFILISSSHLKEDGLVSALSPSTISLLALAPARPRLSGYPTSICSVELDAKVPLGSARVVAGSEDYPTDGFVFPDHTGDGRRGHYPVVSDDQATHLRKCHTGASVSWRACWCI